jgi:hypothetical protein
MLLEASKECRGQQRRVIRMDSRTVVEVKKAIVVVFGSEKEGTLRAVWV